MWRAAGAGGTVWVGDASGKVYALGRDPAETPTPSPTPSPTRTSTGTPTAASTPTTAVSTATRGDGGLPTALVTGWSLLGAAALAGLGWLARTARGDG
jgi:hypothetical protein